MARYSLSEAADNDLDRILDYGIDKYGLADALEHHKALKQRFASIAENPFQYQAVEHIRAGYRRCPYKSESIYYQVIEGQVVIQRILEYQSTEQLV